MSISQPTTSLLDTARTVGPSEQMEAAVPFQDTTPALQDRTRTSLPDTGFQVVVSEAEAMERWLNDGHTSEKKAMEQWLDEGGASAHEAMFGRGGVSPLRMMRS